MLVKESSRIRRFITFLSLTDSTTFPYLVYDSRYTHWTLHAVQFKEHPAPVNLSVAVADGIVVPPPGALSPDIRAKRHDSVAITSGRIVAIDDVDGDDLTHLPPVFSPSDAWNIGATRHVQLDTSRVFHRSWHDTTAHSTNPVSNISFSFTGVTLDVFCIITNDPEMVFPPTFDRFAKYTFLMDGETVGEYRHEPEDRQDYFYNVTVYSNQTLENRNHDFTIVLNPDEKPVLILFDYAAYTQLENDTAPLTTTFSNSPPTSSAPTSAHSAVPTTFAPHKSVNIAAIVGGTLGGVAFIVLGAVLMLCLRRKTYSPSVPQGRSTPFPFTPNEGRSPTPVSKRQLRESSPYSASVAASMPLMTPFSNDSQAMAGDINELTGILQDVARDQEEMRP